MIDAHKITRRKFLLSTGGALMVGATVGSLGPSCARMVPKQTEKSSSGLRNIEGVLISPPAPHVTSAPDDASDIVRDAQDQVNRLLHSVTGKQLLAGTWYVDGAYLSEKGYIATKLKSHDGQAFKVYMFRRGAFQNGVASTRKFELFIMNGGMGRKPTEKRLEAAVIALKKEVEHNEGGSPLLRKVTTWRRYNRL